MSSEGALPQNSISGRPGGDDSCTDIFSDMWTCAGPAGQLGAVYRHGMWANCAEIYVDWRRCLFAKVCGEEKQRELYESMARTKRAKGGHDIWELKSVPSWDVEK